MIEAQHPMERWKPVVGYEQHYEVSDQGRVKRISTGKALKANVNTNKYKSVSLSVGGVVKPHRIHRLVAIAFLGPQDGLVVNHKDGDKGNNKLSNLEWCTYSDNHKHAFRVLGKAAPTSMKGRFGSDHNRSKALVVVGPDGRVQRYGSGLEFRRQTGRDHTSISWAAKNKTLPYQFKKGGMVGYTLLSVE